MNPFQPPSHSLLPSQLRDFPRHLNPYDITPNRPIANQFRAGQTYTQRQMKQLVQEMRFKQKMQAINKKKGKYKRSTNNCHKKYIGILKNLVFLKIQNIVKQKALSQYHQYRNSRVYYFIILSYLKWYLSVADIRWVYQHFCKEVEGKMTRYKLEINTTNNSNFVHFRRDQIIEMDYSVQSINHFLMGEEEEAMRILYQKNKYIIIKKNQYLKTLQIIKQLRTQLQTSFPDLNINKKLSQLKLEEVYSWKKEDTDLINAFPLFQSEREPQFNKKSMGYRQCGNMLMKEEEMDEGDIDSNNDESERYDQMGYTPFKSERMMVKQQEKAEEQAKNFPLIGLQNSYPSIDFLTWNSWLLQKQKRFQFYIRTREELFSLKTNSQAFIPQQPINT